MSFYEGLGFKTLYEFVLDEQTTRTTCAAFGAPPQRHRAVFMSLGDSPTAMILDLVQWFDPDTGGEVYPTMTDVGVHRLAFHVDNPQEVFDELARRGVEFLGPMGIGTSPGGVPDAVKVFAFRDPDGNVLEVLSGVDHMSRPPLRSGTAGGAFATG